MKHQFTSCSVCHPKVSVSFPDLHPPNQFLLRIQWKMLTSSSLSSSSAALPEDRAESARQNSQHVPMFSYYSSAAVLCFFLHHRFFLSSTHSLSSATHYIRHFQFISSFIIYSPDFPPRLLPPHSFLKLRDSASSGSFHFPWRLSAFASHCSCIFFYFAAHSLRRCLPLFSSAFFRFCHYYLNFAFSYLSLFKIPHNSPSFSSSLFLFLNS